MQVLGQCPLGSRLCLWSSPSPLTSTAEFCSCQIHGQLWPGWCPGDPWQPPTSRHTSDSDALVSATFSTPVTPGPMFTSGSSHPIIAALSQVYWLASDICLNWSGPGPLQGEILLESQWSKQSQDSPSPWTFPSLISHHALFCLKPERWNQNLPSSFPHFHNTLEWEGLDLLSIFALCFYSSETANVLS